MRFALPPVQGAWAALRRVGTLLWCAAMKSDPGPAAQTDEFPCLPTASWFQFPVVADVLLAHPGRRLQFRSFETRRNAAHQLAAEAVSAMKHWPTTGDSVPPIDV